MPARRRVATTALFPMAMAPMLLAGCGLWSSSPDERVQAAHQAVLAGPDLVVRSVRGPTSAPPGNGFEVSVEVCNHGFDGAASAEVDVVLSADNIIDPGDTHVASLWIDDLAPGVCKTRNISAWPGNPLSGAFVLGAVVDPMDMRVEANETNNTATGSIIAFGLESDMVVTSVSGPKSVTSNNSFQVAVTVCNQGQASSYGSQVDVVMSTDDTIDALDMTLGAAWPGPLDPGACTSMTIPSMANAMDGVYTLGAIVDRHDDEIEILENNNARAGQALIVGAGPDLIVSAVHGPTNAAPYTSLSARVTVCNQGQSSSYDTSVDLVLSTDAEIDGLDTLIGGGYVDMLDPGACADVNTPAYADAPVGTYTLGAIVDANDSLSESVESNNTGAGGRMSVGYDPDLVITEVRGPHSASPYGYFNVKVTVCNQGQGPASGGGLEVMLSADDTVAMDDLVIGNVPIGSLTPGACTTQTVSTYAYAQRGAYRLGAVVDGGNFELELDESNNAYTGGIIGIGDAPDLVVTDVRGPKSAGPGMSVPVEVTVCNQGQSSSTTSEVRVLLSGNDTIESSDTAIGSTTVSNLYPGRCTTYSIMAYPGLPEGAYTLGAIVDAMDSEVELIENNNSLAGELMGIGSRPDLVVSAIQGPRSTQPGTSFEVAVTLCNQGQAWSGDASFDVMLSGDRVVNASDVRLGRGWASLDAGACRDVTIQVYAPSVIEGAYTLGAIADLDNYQSELIESNNSTAGELLGVGYRPDLVVSRVSGPKSIAPWGGFQVEFTVCNQGRSLSSFANVDVRLSADDTIDSSDTFLGGIQLSDLAPGMCKDAMTWVYANGVQGVYTLGAVVDAQNFENELIETNNSKAAGLLGIGYEPDLIVTGVRGPASVMPGYMFETTITVCNQGQSDIAGTPVHVALSTDSIIDASDELLGSAPIDALSPGRCTNVRVQGSGSMPEGVYTLGAVVDPWNYALELIETNNAMAGGLVAVGYGPDLVVRAVKGPASARPGNGFYVDVTACNQGTTWSGGGTIDVVLSSDPTIDTFDDPLGHEPVGGLQPGECRTTHTWVYANVMDGTYTLGAIADRGNTEMELIESNNTGTGALMGVGYGPDLIVAGVSGPASVLPGNALDVSVTVCNQGQDPSGGGSVDVVLSPDSTIDMYDYLVGNEPLPSLWPGSCRVVLVHGYPGVPEGAYTIGAVVDRYRYEPELIESNNSLAGGLVGVGFRPDLVISAVSGPASARPGNGFTVDVTVCNQGQSSAPGSHVEVVLSPGDSPDVVPGPWDLVMGGAPIGDLAQGACTRVPVSAYAGVPEGVYTLGAMVDRGNSLYELIESNNAGKGPVLGVGFVADLVIASVSGPRSAQPGTSFEVDVTVCNQGQESSNPGTVVDVVLSPDDLIDTFDMPSGYSSVDSLQPGECETVTAPAYAQGPDGAYTLGAIVDRGHTLPELIDSNNAGAGSSIGIGHAADLVITEVRGPASAMPGSSFEVSVTACNQGQGPSAGTSVDIVLSPDGEIDSFDLMIGSAALNTMAPGSCTTRTIMAYAQASEGLYTLGAVVDRNHNEYELIESNNDRAGGLLAIGHGPDLVITAVSGPASARPGSSFDVDVTVCNQGQDSSMGGGVDLVLSQDSAIDVMDSLAGGAPVGNLMPGACATVRAPAYTSLPDGVYTLGAIVDRQGYVIELIESNNTRAAGLIGIGARADLVVSTVSGPPSGQPSQSYDAEVTVCNQGQELSQATGVDVLLSRDSAITMSDNRVGSAPAPSLAPGACATVVVVGSVPGYEGTFVLGAIVDQGNYEPELIESNNTRAGARIGIGYAPDLVVSAVSGPPSAQPSSSFDVTVTVCNQGQSPSMGTQVDLLFSPDSVIDAHDELVGGLPVPSLAPGVCTQVTVPSYAVWTEGVFTLGAFVDMGRFEPELLESNNAQAGGTIAVGHAPDLVITNVSGPASVTMYTEFFVDVTVCNQGQSSNASTNVDLVLSTDTNLMVPPDLLLSGAPASLLAPGACETLTISAYASMSQGTYTLGALVDHAGYQYELREDNNSKVAGAVRVDP